MRASTAIAVSASLASLLLGLAGCAAPEPPASPTSTASSTPTPGPAASDPLDCDALVPADLVAATLEGADGMPVEPVAAVEDHRAFDAVLLEGAGGLPCSWRVGDGMPEYNAPSDWAYLRVDVLPGAASQWVPVALGDAPSDETREIAGIEASVAVGDPGWAISAPVGDAWVVVSLSAAAHTSTGDRFAGLQVDMMDRLAAVAEAAFTALQQATPDQLDWPALELRQTDAVCNGGLDEQGVVAAMQLPAGTTVEYTMSDPAATAPEYFTSAVAAAARAFTCEAWASDGTWLRITAARGLSPLFGRFGEPDADLALSQLELADTPPDTSALVSGTGRASTVLLSLGGTLYRIEGEHAPDVAQAIVAQTY
ncbi:hypothetical protein ACFPER_09340 [Agromyces aurantiacus]|uniref:DUF2020 domain-containing protein n=1 Tax=Agromyces aurantiacus TaxID=165814 RepID=A0ABV9R4F1_9MICO|nr:hypothetical protein [Agromyces aurantiacus]MBM7503676.1 hypothetical protein [Agromyces aurantiacus]